MFSLESDQIINLQNVDPMLEKVNSLIVDGGLKDEARIFSQNGALFRRRVSREDRVPQFCDQLVEPKQCELALLELPHDIPLSVQ